MMKHAYYILALLLAALPIEAHAFRTTTSETTATVAIEFAAMKGDATCMAQPGDKVLVLGTPTFLEVVPDPALETVYTIRLTDGKCAEHEATVLQGALKDIISQ